MTTRSLSFSGGGHNTHSLLAGYFAGALDRLDALGSRSGLDDLMQNVDSISGLSGGSWFLSHLAYSSIYNRGLATTSARDAYTTSAGYLGALNQVIDSVDALELPTVPPELISIVDDLQSLQTEVNRAIQQLFNNVDAAVENGLSSSFLRVTEALDSLTSIEGLQIPEGFDDAVSQFRSQALAFSAASSAARRAEVAALLATGQTALNIVDFLVTGTRDALEYLEFVGKLAKFILVDGSRDWRKIVDGLVYAPLGINRELRDLTLQSSPLPWAADKDLIIASGFSTSEAVLVAQPVVGQPGVFDRIFSSATSDPQPSGLFGDRPHVRPMSISSVVDSTGNRRGVVDIPGAPLGIVYSNNKLLGPADVSISGLNQTLEASSLRLTDATVASSAALALLAQPQASRLVALLAKIAIILRADTPFDLPGDILLTITPIEEYLAQAFRDLAPLATLKGDTLAMPAAPPDLEPDFLTNRFSDRFTAAVDNRELRIFDGGYSENSSAANMLRHLQQKSLLQTGETTPFDLTVFINSDGNPSDTSVEVQGVGRFRINADLALLFGLARDSFPFSTATREKGPGELVNGPFPVLTNQRSSPQLFSADAWLNETGPEWKVKDGDLTIEYFDLNVNTINNPQLGIRAGQQGRLRVFTSNNAASFALPLKPGGMENYQLNYNFVRSAINQEAGDLLLFSALGLLPLISFAGQELVVIGDHASANLVGRETADSLFGGDANDTLLGQAGPDVLIGGAGRDILDGGPGRDRMSGGLDNDLYVVNNALDQVIENPEQGVDTVRATISLVLAANVEHLELLGAQSLSGTGNALDNQLIGNDAANTLDGAAGNDQLDGRAGADVLVGGLGDDVFVVDHPQDQTIELPGEGVDAVLSSVSHKLADHLETLRLTGRAAIDGLGNDEENVIEGNDAANVLNGRQARDVLRGGAGNDTYILDADDKVADVIEEGSKDKDSGGVDLVRSALTFTLPERVENLILTGADPIDGTGNAGKNILIGNAADNRLNGAGNDDSLLGGAGNDTYIVDSRFDQIVELVDEGYDVVRSLVSYSLPANVEALILDGDASINATGNILDNVISGNAAANILDGSTGADILEGGLGDDIYVIDNAADVVVEGAAAGRDTVQSSVSRVLGSHQERLVLTGNAAIDGTGNALANQIVGNAAANVLDGAAGADTLSGGAGDDTYVLDSSGDRVVELLGGGRDAVHLLFDRGAAGLEANVENLVLLGSVRTGAGNGLANVITGNAAANVLDGQSGVDTLIGGEGDDTYRIDHVGDVVDDFVLVRSTSGPTGSLQLLVRANAGIDEIQSVVSYVLPAFIEHLVLTGVAAINGTGNGLDNRIIGNAGPNLLQGFDGSDQLIGGQGSDSILGGIGNDQLQGDEEGLLAGSGGNDSMDGGAGNDTLSGGVGNDTMDGGAGADFFVGGAGNDVFIVDDSGDRISEEPNAGKDTVISTVSRIMRANLEDLILVGTDSVNGTGNDVSNRITGNDAANVLEGGQGDDTVDGLAGEDVLKGDSGDDFVRGGRQKDQLSGDEGNDRLNGNRGNDTLIGGLGADIFMLSRNSDVIVDFNAAEGDRIEVLATTPFRLASSGADGSGDLQIIRDVGTTTLLGVSLNGFDAAVITTIPDPMSPIVFPSDAGTFTAGL